VSDAAAVLATVLVVDDDPDLRAALTRALTIDGYAVSTASNGAKALESLAEAPADLLVLDVMMPVVGGLEVCRRLRAAGNRIPILVLTARDQVSDRVAGLDAGADDYLVKPFALDELRARLRALLRRSVPDDAGAGSVLRYADVTLDLDTREVRRGERPIELTRTEFALLELFVRNAGKVLTREVIMERVWGYELEPASNSLEVFVGYLRRKTEAGGEPRILLTVRGVGYQLKAPQ
jgi:two-component system, OmpR family, response regulator MprA